MFGKTFLPLILLCGVCFCLACNYDAAQSPTLALLNQPSEIALKSKENAAETPADEKQPSDCNKPENDDERLLCAAIIKGIDKEILEDLTEELTFVSGRADLNGDGRDEIFVWLTARRWGGSSGYDLMVFSQEAKGYKKLWESDSVWTPIILLNSKSHGWRDLCFQIGGGGAEWLYVVIKHNGKKYKDDKIFKEQPKGEFIIEQNWNSTVFGGMPSQ